MESAAPRFIVRGYDEIRNGVMDLNYRLSGMLRKEGNPSAIICPLRGGMFASRTWSDLLGVRDIVAVDVRAYEGMKIQEGDAKIEDFASKLGKFDRDRGWFLLVDDVVDSGKTMKAIVDRITGTMPNKVVTCSVDYKPNAVYTPDYYVNTVNPKTWIIYEYELFETLRELRGAGNSGDLMEFNNAIAGYGNGRLMGLLPYYDGIASQMQNAD